MYFVLCNWFKCSSFIYKFEILECNSSISVTTYHSCIFIDATDFPSHLMFLQHLTYVSTNSNALTHMQDDRFEFQPGNWHSWWYLMKIQVLWYITLCHMVNSYWRFESAWCLHLQNQSQFFLDSWALKMEATRSVTVIIENRHWVMSQKTSSLHHHHHHRWETLMVTSNVFYGFCHSFQATLHLGYDHFVIE